MEEQGRSESKVVGVVKMDRELDGVITTTERVIELTKRVYFHRGVWAGFIAGAGLVGLIWWLS